MPAYRAGFRAHQAWLRRDGAGLGPAPALPLVVVGALRAGGAGKTSFVSALARELVRRGLRPALLAYRLGPGLRSGADGRLSPAGGGRAGAADPADGLLEVGPDSDWRATSEEAVLLRRESGARVFATRDRARAWRALARGAARGDFDIVLSDDGFQDPRLYGAFRILLARPGEGPGFRDLLPAGPYRETASAAARADLVATGPWPAGPDRVTGTLLVEGRALPAGPRFRRRLILPGGWDRSRPCLAHCSLGDPHAFLSDLGREGVRPAGIVLGRNHAEPPLARLRASLARFPGAAILCTRKDAVKLEGSGLPLFPVDQEIELDAEAPARVAALARSGPHVAGGS